MVTLLDATIATGYGPIRVLNDQKALAVGESLEAEGVRIEFLSTLPSTDVVGVEILGP